MKSWKKIFSIEIKEKYLAVLAVLALGGLLLPLLRLACYSIPWYDDYNFMWNARAYSEQFGKSFLYGAFQTMRQEWYAWQGTYSTTFLTALNPFLWGEEYQKVGIMAVILCFTAAVFVFSYVLLGNVLGAKKSSKYLIASVVSASCIGLIYTSQQGLYWYNAAVHYTLMPGILFLMLAAMVKILYCRKRVSAVLLMCLATVLGIICAGSNYVTILQGLLLLLTILLLAVLARKKNTAFLIFPIVTYVIAFWVNVSAPGNSVRGSAYPGDGFTDAILNSFLAAGKYFWELTGPMMVVMLLLLLPAVWNLVKDTDFTFRYPVLVTLYSICLYATGFTSSRFAMGTDGLSRTWVAIKFTLQILLFLNEIYWLGWFAQKKKSRRSVADCRHYVVYYLLMAGLVIGVFCLTPNKAGSYAPYGAYYYVHTGEAYNFYQEYLGRVETLKGEEKNVVFKPYSFKPWMLYRGDLASDPNAEQNKSLARWYGKESVVVAEDTMKNETVRK